MPGAAHDKKDNSPVGQPAGAGQAANGPISDDAALRGGLAELARMTSGGHGEHGEHGGQQDLAAMPPVHLWDPPSCGDIGLEVRGNGEWWHQGAPIPRKRLARLFASLLKRDGDGQYWVVTPVEKAPVRVAVAPLLAVGLVVDHASTPDQAIGFVTNMGDTFWAGPDNPIWIEHGRLGPDHRGRAEPAPLVIVRHGELYGPGRGPGRGPDRGPGLGIEALLTRACYYELADLVEQDGAASFVRSRGCRFVLDDGTAPLERDR